LKLTGNIQDIKDKETTRKRFIHALNVWHKELGATTEGYIAVQRLRVSE
jgi:hypothetical protein